MLETIYCTICNDNKFDPFIKINDNLKIYKNFSIIKCKCDFVYLNPRPNSEDIKQYYCLENYMPHNKKNKTIFFNIYKLVQYFTVRWKSKKINYKNGQRLLDIGGGDGVFAKYISGKGLNVTLQDAYYDKNNINKNYIYANDLDEIVSKNKFDFITLWHSLEHIHDLDKLFFNINRLLLNEGELIIAVPNLNAPERKFYNKDWAAYDAPRHLYHFNFTTLEKICNKYKFKVIRKYCLYQDTPYNILLSISRKNFINIFKAFFIFVYSMLITLLFGPNYSSSILIICKKY
tara:strand:+ start:120 stop:986 length:867 start_codon:yes stop_codon:yes gene_type:complete